MKKQKIGVWNEISDFDLAREAPVTFVYRDALIPAVLAVFFGGSFTLIPLAYLIKTVINHEPLSDALPLLPITLLFAPLLIFGINLWVRQKELWIARDEVGRIYKNLFRRVDWREPVSHYSGVLLMTDAIPDGGEYSGFGYSILLFHRDSLLPGQNSLQNSGKPDEPNNFTPPQKLTARERLLDKSIPLFSSLQYTRARNAWKKYAQFFNLPLLERITPSEFVSYPPGSGGAAMMDLIADNQIPVNLNPGPLPKSFQFHTAKTDHHETIAITFPDKTEILLELRLLTIRRPGWMGGDFPIELPNIAAITVESAPQAHLWRHAVIVREKNTHIRHTLGHNQPLQDSLWLFRFLIGEITRRRQPGQQKEELNPGAVAVKE